MSHPVVGTSRRVARTMAKKALLREMRGLPEEVQQDDYEEGDKTLPPQSQYTLPTQQILEVFTTSFHALLESEMIEEFVQMVKTDLYNRDYMAAFEDDDKRFAYVCRWSSSRALAYASLFASLPEVRSVLRCESSLEDEMQRLSMGSDAESDAEEDEGEDDTETTTSDETKQQEFSVVSIGGGAGGELAAFVSCFVPSRDFDAQYRVGHTESETKLNIKLIDIANWRKVVNRLTTQMESKWLGSKQSENLNVEFVQGDALKVDIGKPDLITLLFTTNELFAADRAGAIRFFQGLNDMKSGCLLLVAESAGSYSHITVGTKKFPIQFMIDMLLLGKNKEDGAWEVVSENDSLWYRCPKDAEYPLKLENMRFFYRLYRKK